MRTYLNDDWFFVRDFSALADVSDGSRLADVAGVERVRLPHSVVETPFNYFDEHIYQMTAGYARELFVPEDARGKALFLTFEGVAHRATVFVNGAELYTHGCGYTAFTVDVSRAVRYGEKNLVVVRVESSETLNQPPFGFVIDYMTYGGIYREVYFEVKNAVSIADVFAKPNVTTPLGGGLSIGGTVSGRVESDVTLVVAGAGTTLGGAGIALTGAGATNIAGTNLMGAGTVSKAGTALAAAGDAGTTTKADTALGGAGATGGAGVALTSAGGYTLTQRLVRHGADDIAGQVLAEASITVHDAAAPQTITLSADGLSLWDVERPALYDLITTLRAGTSPAAGQAGTALAGNGTTDIAGSAPAGGTVLDERIDTIGFRESEFTKDGYFLNGRRLKIRGLNRHQSYPYVGYAMPKSMQALDADILKNELGLNAVRTSHYPQSQHFVNRCDELGLLVFTEMPGWQHIGDAAWKDQAVRNTEDMVKQYRNHPSVVLWGVRINESPDDDEFYTRTNAAARALDPTRPTAGVKAGQKMSFLEDVYTYNDFSFSGGDLHEKRDAEKACLEKKDVTPDVSRPYMVTEYNGHMFPTKTFDCEDHRREHALRHAAVLNSVAARPEICGSFGWCMADYNTHKDFGSGDRICYHGVLDMFRNHKVAAAVYASQSPLGTGAGTDAVLEVSTTMDIGEHPACLRSDTVIFSNAPKVRFYKNNQFIKEFTPARDSVFVHLPHGPMYVDDFISENMQKTEGWSDKKTALVKTCLNAFARYGSKCFSPKVVWAAARLVLFHGLKMNDTTRLYNKYVGDWGGEATTYRFDAVDENGTVLKTKKCAPVTAIHLEAAASSTALREETTYDVALVRLRMVDQNGNVLPWYGESVRATASGAVCVLGPELVPLRGGMAGVYVKTTGEAGEGAVMLEAPGAAPLTVTFAVEVAR